MPENNRENAPCSFVNSIVSTLKLRSLDTSLIGK
jgi:hypothetical protein